jgi:hypothetical protein
MRVSILTISLFIVSILFTNPVIRLLRLLIESVSSFSINLRIIKIKNPAVRAPAIGNPTFSATCKNSSI